MLGSGCPKSRRGGDLAGPGQRVGGGRPLATESSSPKALSAPRPLGIPNAGSRPHGYPDLPIARSVIRRAVRIIRLH
jgi:hypothetical protein